jgi:hypothetical protein
MNFVVVLESLSEDETRPKGRKPRSEEALPKVETRGRKARGMGE